MMLSPLVCFNEAAGIPRGRRVEDRQAGGREHASMRPRVFPAEDGSPRADHREEWCWASMRPRVFPAEDVKAVSAEKCRDLRFNEAAGIPRGRRRAGGLPAGGRRCFNEAAGIPRGRPMDTTSSATTLTFASMRPRVFPAEDDRAVERDPPRHRASMRPRVFPAEDSRSRSPPRRRTRASMRPRVFPAEDVLGQPSANALIAASMRPRVFPAEDLEKGLSHAWQDSTASMRPRVFPAEDTNPKSRHSSSGRCFNEAAGIPRGRP